MAEVKATKKEKKKTTKEEAKSLQESAVVVGDPEVFRPKELPLVVKPKSGKWKNEAQERYAAILNGYAYSNPEKWKAKKEKLLRNLELIGEDPSKESEFSPRGGPQFRSELIG